MKQLLILSGKGGTGKTTVAAAFIQLSKAKAYADCDVDAPNLHLITHQHTPPRISDYYGLAKAEIDPDRCIGCDLCKKNCRFEAILPGSPYRVNPYACEGCGVCEWICPSKAISMKPSVDGSLQLYREEDRVFSTAELKMGSGTSGMLVTKVKKQMTDAKMDAPLAIIDGSPGIGCPVIASLSGVDLVLIVGEPSISGISDMERIIATARKFGVKAMVCTNKFDANLENTEKIEAYCFGQGLEYMGRIPYDEEVVKAVNTGRTITEVDCAAGRAIGQIHDRVMEHL